MRNQPPPKFLQALRSLARVPATPLQLRERPPLHPSVLHAAWYWVMTAPAGEQLQRMKELRQLMREAGAVPDAVAQRCVLVVRAAPSVHALECTLAHCHARHPRTRSFRRHTRAPASARRRGERCATRARRA